MTFEEKTLNSEYVYKGKILNLRKDTVEVVNGGHSVREIVEHNGGAVIVAIKDNGNMLMVEQFRKPVENVVLEVPAGKIDPGEQPLETALRELKEETGYKANNISFLTKIYPSVGYSQEVLYLFLCTELIPGDTDFDDNEAIDIKEYSVDQLYRMVMDGKICDAKSQVAILMAKELLSKEALPKNSTQ